MFKELAEEKYLKRISIDSKLIPAFKNVMARLDDYFEKNGLSNVKDYWELFEKSVLLPEENSNTHYLGNGKFQSSGYYRKKIIN